MAYYRKAVGIAAALNMAICIGEAVAGFGASSQSLMMDSIHNLSDQLALVLLYLALFLPQVLSRNVVRLANVLNSIGLLLVSGVLVWYTFQRMLAPIPVVNFVPIAAGLLAAAANWGVARLLLRPGQQNPAIRLAYIHNLGDVLVSLAPVLVGLLATIFEQSFFDPLIALLIAGWFMWSTLKEVLASHQELLAPERMICDHAPEEAVAMQSA
jgi:Co/Zn/Cd efflux system component